MLRGLPGGVNKVATALASVATCIYKYLYIQKLLVDSMIETNNGMYSTATS